MKSLVQEKKRKNFNVTFITELMAASLFLCFMIRYAAGCTFKFTSEEEKQYYSNSILTHRETAKVDCFQKC